MTEMKQFIQLDKGVKCPFLWKKIPFYLKAGEAERVDTSAAAVVDSAVRGALWDSACLSSGLNVTNDRDHWSFFHISHNSLLFTILWSTMETHTLL